MAPAHAEAPSDPQHLADAVGRAMYSRDLASQGLGIDLVGVGPGTATMTMKVRPDMCNGHRTCHGGFIFTLADSAFAFACNSYNHNAVALGCTIDFVAPARQGDLLTAVARVRQQGSRTGVYDITVTNQDGAEVALFRGKSYRIRGTVLGG